MLTFETLCPMKDFFGLRPPSPPHETPKNLQCPLRRKEYRYLLELHNVANCLWLVSNLIGVIICFCKSVNEIQRVTIQIKANHLEAGLWCLKVMSSFLWYCLLCYIHMVLLTFEPLDKMPTCVLKCMLFSYRVKPI